MKLRPGSLCTRCHSLLTEETYAYDPDHPRRRLCTICAPSPIPATPTRKRDQMSNLPAVPSDRAGGLTFAEFIDIAKGQKELPERDGDEILAEILSADSLEVLEKGSVVGLRSFVGQEVVIHGFRLNRSDEQYAEGGPVYAVLDITSVKDGERLKSTSGSKNVLAALGLMLKLDKWDERYRVEQEETAAGFKVTKLVHIPAVEPFPEA